MYRHTYTAAAESKRSDYFVDNDDCEVFEECSVVAEVCTVPCSRSRSVHKQQPQQRSIIASTIHHFDYYTIHTLNE